jgi:hypothetical protein
VLSVEDSPAVSIVVGGRSPTGPWWRFLPGTLNGDRLVCNVRAGSAMRYDVNFRNDNAGSITLFFDRGNNAPRNSNFTRLD